MLDFNFSRRADGRPVTRVWPEDIEMKSKPKQTPSVEGLIGLFGHTYIVDPENTDERTIQYQFRIIRKLEPDRYIIQYFSFLDGSPDCLGVMPETELLGPSVKLYATAELWNIACETESEKHR